MQKHRSAYSRSCQVEKEIAWKTKGKQKHSEKSRNAAVDGERLETKTKKKKRNTVKNHFHNDNEEHPSQPFVQHTLHECSGVFVKRSAKQALRCDLQRVYSTGDTYTAFCICSTHSVFTAWVLAYTWQLFAAAAEVRPCIWNAYENCTKTKKRRKKGEWLAAVPLVCVGQVDPTSKLTTSDMQSPSVKSITNWGKGGQKSPLAQGPASFAQPSSLALFVEPSSVITVWWV